MRGLTRVAGAAAMCAVISAGAAAVSAESRAMAAPVSAAAPGTTAPHALVAGTSRPTVRNDRETSNNWAGYAVQTKEHRRFTDVAGTWAQPRVSCTRTGSSYASFWVGIDGYASKSVEQIGTDSDCENKTASYYAWWEMYPALTIQLSPTRFPVEPGDVLTAGVSVRHGDFVLTLKSSRGWTFSHVSPAGPTYAQSSAEWVAEAPVINNSIARLASFAAFGFSRCSAATNGGADSPISSFISKQPHEMTMVSAGGAPEATPSALSGQGHSFSVAWDRA